MPKIKLTHRGIETLKAGKWLTDFMDDTLTGFGVRVHHTGRKAFFVRYDLGAGRKRMTLGTYPSLSLADARSQAKDILGRVARGEDPQEEKRADRAAQLEQGLARYRKFGPYDLDSWLSCHYKHAGRKARREKRGLWGELLPVIRNLRSPVTGAESDDPAERPDRIHTDQVIDLSQIRVVSKILNHVESGITAVYDRHSYDAEKREALIQWADKLQSILG